jgi:mono/diheme cytochrome c family protein
MPCSFKMLAVHTDLAARGRELFSQTCAKCHGTYGPGGTYPNKIVPLHKIGTDQTLDVLRYRS